MAKQTRREFLEATAKVGGAVALSGAMSIDSVLGATPTPAGANNAKESASVLSVPKSTGSIKGIGETFQASPFTGTANFTVPIVTSEGRAGFGPQLSLQYSNGNAQGPFSMGWSLSIPQITRKTEEGIPRYNDNQIIDPENKDTFLLSGAEDLVERDDVAQLTWPALRGDFKITYYRPRTEGMFARIEKWDRVQGVSNPLLNDSFWKVTTKENITNIYGLCRTASLNDFNDARKIFQWMLELTFDAKGNYVYYAYKGDCLEDIGDEIFELHRKGTQRTFHIYPKYIRYGNNQPFVYSDLDSIIALLLSPPSFNDNFFNIKFDYGEHEEREAGTLDRVITEKIYTELRPWDKRKDPFSSYRAGPGLEMRCNRLCQRVLVFHNIPGQAEPTLVKSTDFRYDYNPGNLQAILKAVTQRGYRRKSGTTWSKSEEFYLNEAAYGVKSQHYTIKSYPPLEFKYSEYNFNERRFKRVKIDEQDLAPNFSNPDIAFVDLFKTGLPDILETTQFGYFYYRNLGNGTFSARRKLKFSPAGVTLGTPGVGFGDMSGDGSADLLIHAGAKWGFFEADEKEGWKNFRNYKFNPTFSLTDPQIKLFDVTGNGKSDVMRTDDSHFTFFQCKGEAGFEAPRYVSRVHDPEIFPDVFFSDPRVRLADFSGDGLQDIVIVNSGRIDYYPNTGYGTFGKRITMTNSPSFGKDFNPNYLFVVDLDGSGPGDLVYVESGRIRFWLNQSGNGFSEEYTIPGTPRITDSDKIQFIDILGNGTSCIVIQSNSIQQSRPSLFYLDFTGGVKPNMLTELNNNLGAITKLTYKPSTHFMLEDQHSMPWLSTLPFAVSVLEKSEVIDTVSRSRQVTRYAYHHGFHSGKHEHEFRGFAAVDSWDTEYVDEFAEASATGTSLNTDEAFYSPPVLTRTWYHTGAFDDDAAYANVRDYINNNGQACDFNNLFERDYYQDDPLSWKLKNSVIESTTVDSASLPEAYRALRGNVLRREVYSITQGSASEHPYIVTESNFKVRLLQKKGKDKRGVYLSFPLETLNYYYERNPADPRISHEINLLVDAYGNVTDKVSVSYPRRISIGATTAPLPEQVKLQTMYVNYRFANKLPATDFYCVGLPVEETAYEVEGIPYGLPKLLSAQDFTPLFNAAQVSSQGYLWVRPQNHAGISRRLLKHERTYYKANSAADKCSIQKNATSGFIDRTLAHRLPLGDVESLMLTYEKFTASFTDSMIAELFGNQPGSNTPRVDATTLKQAGYFLEDNIWWIPSGQSCHKTNGFYVPEVNVDTQGNRTTVTYDGNYLLPISVVDPLGNATSAYYDYYTLSPSSTTDANLNGVEVQFDALGMVTASAIMGKTTEGVGDSLSGLTPELDYSTVLSSGVAGDPVQLLGRCSTRVIYDLWRHRRMGAGNPLQTYTVKREIHDSDSAGASPVVRRMVQYSDGFGREIQSKIEVEGAEATPNKLRWLTTGWKVFCNKGVDKPVLQFDPFFSDSADYQFNLRHGVYSTTFYDPLLRMVTVLRPDNSFDKMVFTPWKQEVWDANDMVLIDPLLDADIAPYVTKFIQNKPGFKTWYQQRQISTDPLPSIQNRSAGEQSAIQTRLHAATPAEIILDNLGRPFLTVQNTGTVSIVKGTALDIEGKVISTKDGRGIINESNKFTMTGAKAYAATADGGLKLTLSNPTGQVLSCWDSNGNHLSTAYDALNRATETWVSQMGGPFKLVQRNIYGEEQPTATATTNNLKLKLWKVYDGAGCVVNNKFDFKGNLTSSTRFILKSFTAVTWAQKNTANDNFSEAYADTLLQPTGYTTNFAYNALNKVLSTTYADGSVQQWAYNNRDLTIQVKVKRRAIGNGTWTTDDILKNAWYNEKSQAYKVVMGNDVRTRYEYDPQTFRLTRLFAYRKNVEADLLQDIHFTYDPVGNIVRKEDKAIPTMWYNQQEIQPVSYYVYDAIYRLVVATGREHKSFGSSQDYSAASFKQGIFVQMNPPVADATALQMYVESYTYDASGNMLTLTHAQRVGLDQELPRGLQTQWVRYFGSNDKNNQLAFVGNNSTLPALTSTWDNLYDANGNTIKTPQLPSIGWNHFNQVVDVSLNGGATPDKAYYQYDASGTRIRKYLKKGAKIEERIYLGGFEIYRETNGATTLQRNTAILSDGASNIGMLEQKVKPDDPATVLGSRAKYQLVDQLKAVCLEVDDSPNAKVISAEEYSAYGSTTIIAGENSVEVSLKTYRYSGQERDDETNFYYHGMRYYVPWTCRWLSPDPAKADANHYRFVSNNPINLRDPSGMDGEPAADGYIDLKADQVKSHLEDVRNTHNQLVEENGIGNLSGSQSSFEEARAKNKGQRWVERRQKPGSNVSAKDIEVTQCIDIIVDAIDAVLGDDPDWLEIKSKLYDSRANEDGTGRAHVLQREIAEKAGYTSIYLAPNVKDQKASDDKNVSKVGAVRAAQMDPPNAKYDAPVINPATGKEMTVGIPIDMVLENFTARGTAKDNWSRDFLSKVKFAIGSANKGTHTFAIIDGKVFEAHWEANPNNTNSRGKPMQVLSIRTIEQFFAQSKEWKSAVISMPTQDVFDILAEMPPPTTDVFMQNAPRRR